MHLRYGKRAAASCAGGTQGATANLMRCLAAALDRIPQRAQWQARQDVLAVTPPNIGKPERAARQFMPRDFYNNVAPATK